jgi:hypothetical protein
MWSVVSDGALSLRDPFFIIGAPRSGTTYLHEVLNRHPEVFLTNETRVMIFVNRALNILGGNRENLLTYRGEFLDFLRRMMPPLIEAFYRELGAPEDSVWGDKYGNYADGLRDRQCLDTIDLLFPDSRFIHIVRDARSVVSSLIKKGWADFETSLDLWERHVVHATRFGRRVGPDRFVEVQYDDLVRDSLSQVARIFDLLDLGMAPEVVDFLCDQHAERTPFSSPVASGRAIGDPGVWAERLAPEQIEQVERAVERVRRLRDEELEETVDAVLPRQWRHLHLVNETGLPIEAYLECESEGQSLGRTRRKSIDSRSTFVWGIQWDRGVVHVCRAGDGRELARVELTPKSVEYFVPVVGTLLGDSGSRPE